MECYFCYKKLNTKTKIAFLFFADQPAPNVSHWACCAGHGDDNLIAIRRAKFGSPEQPMSIDSLTPGQLSSAKNLAKRTRGGRIRSARHRLVHGGMGVEGAIE